MLGGVAAITLTRAARNRREIDETVRLRLFGFGKVWDYRNAPVPAWGQLSVSFVLLPIGGKELIDTSEYKGKKTRLFLETTWQDL